MKKKIFWLILIVLLFVGARQVNAYISDPRETSLVEELASPEWQSGSHAFHNVSKIIESLVIIIGGTENDTINQKLGSSALDAASNLIGYLYIQKPASSSDYFNDLAQRLKIAPPAYAQAGVGFEGLKPILPLWKVFRNIAYVFFTITFVIIGFAIMFRVKLNPQTVITIQNAIPKVVVALILVTFSYAIAGLLIDFTYVLLSIVVVALDPLVDVNLTQMAAEGFGLWRSLYFLITGTGRTAAQMPVWSIGSLAAVGGLGALVGTLFVPGIGTFAGAGIAIGLVILLVSVVILWLILKLFFALVKSYINIIIAIIFAPLQIMLGVLPGGQFGFGTWVRNLFANLMVFPAVGIFFVIGWVLTKYRGPTWVPPVLGTGGGNLTAIIGLGMLLLIHKVPDMVREALQVKVFPYGAEALKPFGQAIALPYKALVTVGAGRRALEDLGRRGGAPSGPGTPTTGVTLQPPRPPKSPGIPGA